MKKIEYSFHLNGMNILTWPKKSSQKGLFLSYVNGIPPGS